MKLLALSVIVLALPAASQSGASQHHADVNRRGAQVMGFDQDATVHRFTLYEDGGSIEVDVKSAADKANRDAIRSHLPHIASLFAEGNFEAPMLVHDTKVPGTAEMARLASRIAYKYVETDRGGRIDIVTTDAEAIAAVHRFLEFQIKDHRTGDSTAVKRRNGTENGNGKW